MNAVVKPGWYNEANVRQPGSVVLKRWNAQRETERRSVQTKTLRTTRAQRDFAAGGQGRLFGGWNARNTSANADLYRFLDPMRGRSRTLCNDNDYAKRFLGMVGANIVGGSGVILQSRIYDAAGKPDVGANDAVELAFEKWGKRGVCEVTGRQSFRDVQLLIAKTCGRDGEALVRFVRGASAGNAFGFALQVLDVDRIDTRLVRAAEPGVNEIKMGVEVDGFGRTVALWLRPYHPGEMFLVDQVAVSSQHVRVPASELIHLYIAERAEQLRGIPWMHAAMIRLNNLGGYEEAAVIAARVGASKMGFFTTPDGTTKGMDDGVGDEGAEDEGIPYTEVDPGQFGVLPEGTTFEAFNPDYPHQMYADFVKACLRGIASGMGVAYHALANDLTSVSFSSIRSGTLEERDQWISLQQWFIDGFMERVFNEWLSAALAFGQITLANGSALPPGKQEKFAAHKWQARRWQWVDPRADMEANAKAVEQGFKAPQTICAELGEDLEDVYAQIARANELAEKLGIKVGTPTPAAPAPAPEPEPEPEADESKPKGEAKQTAE